MGFQRVGHDWASRWQHFHLILMRWGYCHPHFMESCSYLRPGDKKSCGKLWAISELVNSNLHLGEFEPFPCRTALLVSFKFFLWGWSHYQRRLYQAPVERVKVWLPDCWEPRGKMVAGYSSSACSCLSGRDPWQCPLLRSARMGKRLLPGCAELEKESGGVTAS